MDMDKFELAEDEERGRFMVAKQDFEAGQVLFVDKWSIAGPSHTTDPVCLNCLATLSDENTSKCMGCSCPICTECIDPIRLHSQLECQILSESFKTIIGEFPFHSIMPLRLALEASKHSDLWKKLEHLSDHEDDRLKAVEEWELFDKDVVQRLLVGFEQCQLPISSKLFHKCVGIIRINAMGFDLRRNINNQIQRRKGRLLFSWSSMASHNCMNNAIHIISPDTLNLTMKARCNISPGDEISISYVPLMIGEPLRSHHIRNEWFFNCQCKRCIDPTDNQSFISAIICKTCKDEGKPESILLPSCPMTESSLWTSNMCGHTRLFKDVHEEISEVEKELRPLCESSSITALNFYKKFIEKQTSLLHENHFLILIAKRNMLHILKRAFDNCKQMQMVAFGSLNLKHKPMVPILLQRLRISSELLPVIRQLDPNPSDWQKFILTEVMISLTLLRKQFSNDDSESYKESIPSLLKESEIIISAAEKASEENC